jgi:hypothetical protein
MGHKVYLPNGAGIAGWDDGMPGAPRRLSTKVVELAAVQHQPEEHGKFSDWANFQCRQNSYLS